MNTNITTLFVGDEISDPGEQQLISRLQRDLADRGVSATLYANFFPPTRRTGQIDLLVRTPFRTAHVEIKSLNPTYPVVGQPNGHWEQLLPNGSRRSLGKNAGLQARDGTYAISDAIRDLAGAGVVRKQDFTNIDTLVGMWQVVPPGSDITPPPHVTVVSYAELLVRLIAPGPGLDWTEDEWDAFARQANLFQPETDTPEAQRRRSAEEAIADYRIRARAAFSAELGPLVELGAVGPAALMTQADVDRLVSSGAVVALVGPSGAGKSFAARHLAVGHCDAGRIVIWLRAGEYEKGRFSSLVARAMAPFSAERWVGVARPAAEMGVGTTVVLDGLNECPESLRQELLEQLQAFVLRYPAGVLVTSTDANRMAELLGATVLRAGEPNEETRRELLAVHGAKQPDRISAQFRTPFELSIAARCESELTDDATVADLHAAYIGQFAETEQLRSGLRALACHLHSKLRTSVALREATAVLHAAPAALAPDQVDDVLASRLLDVERHRVRFRHELLGQFFAAEDLVRSATSGAELARALGSPANGMLGPTALAVEPDPRKGWAALDELASTTLLRAAHTGDFGPEAAELVAERVRDALRLGVAATEIGRVELQADNWFGRWEPEVPWTRTQQALLTVAGEALMRGRFVEEVCELVDRTDAVCLHHARRLKADGSDSPISTVFANTYNQVHPADGRGLAASYVVSGFEIASMMRRWGPDGTVAGLARRFAATDGQCPWGRLYLAALSVRPDDPADQAEFPSLLRRAWDAGGYHLHLEVLRAAKCFWESAEPHRTEILDLIESFKPGNWAEQDSIIEVLSRFGEIDRGITAEDLREEIRDVIADADSSYACQAAAGIISNQFEDENIVGPYCEAIAELTDTEKVRLFTMGALGSDISISMSLDWTLGELSKLVPTGEPSLDEAAQAAFGAYLNGPPNNTVMPTEATNACLAAIRGWAKFSNALPPETEGLADSARNWRLVAGLLLYLERDDAVGDPAETWRQLHDDVPTTILTLSMLEGAAYRSAFDGRGHALHDLFEAHTVEMRELFEWALDHLEDLPVHQVRRRGGPDHFVIRALGFVGDLGTVERLRVHTLDPEAGSAAVDAVRRIHQRYQT